MGMHAVGGERVERRGEDGGVATGVGGRDGLGPGRRRESKEHGCRTGGGDQECSAHFLSLEGLGIIAISCVSTRFAKHQFFSWIALDDAPEHPIRREHGQKRRSWTQRRSAANHSLLQPYWAAYRPYAHD